MSKKIFLAVGGLIVLGALLVLALQLTAPTRMPNEDAETFARANQLYGNGQYAAAVNLYEQLLAKGVENADLYFNAGTAYTALKQPNKASDAFQRARELSPRDPQIAQAAQIRGFNLPVTQNELMIVLLGLMGFTAVVFVVMRRRNEGMSAA